MIKLISTDFDGTIFAEFHDPPVPLRLQQLIAELQAAGAKWAINTGRDLSSLMEALGRSAISVEPDFLVLVEREIYVHQESQYIGLAEWNLACTRAHAELFARVQPDMPRLVEWISSRFHASLYEDAYSPFCLIARNNEDADQIHSFLEDYCRSVPELTVVRNDVYARFSHAAFNKGSALAELTRRLGLKPEHVFAAGDHLNDLPMLSPEYAAFLAAPSNAIPSVKTAVRRHQGFLSERPYGEGVAEALAFYIQAYA